MDNSFDVVVLGTGLSESIAAAALSKAGLRVAHIDPNPYYGSNEATLTLDELVQWAVSHSTNIRGSYTSDPVSGHYRVDYLSPDCPPHPKQYSISLSPSAIPSVGSFISSVVSSGVSRYGSYKLLGPVAIYRGGKLQNVPQSKESIFQDRTIPLIEKRRLMRFLVFASGDFEQSPEFQGQEDTPFDHFLRESFGLSEEISRVIMFSLASCDFSEESTSRALHRVRSCLRSTGRYGSSPYLVGYYGGSGEIAQGFCRVAAVHGGVYILGRKISNIVVQDVQNPERFSIELEDIPDPLRTSCILSSMTCVPPSLRGRVKLLSYPNVPDARRDRLHPVAHCIAIVNGTLAPPRLNEGELGEGESDSFLVVFPPGSLDGGSTTSSVTLLTAGAGTMSAPSGTNILYLSMPLLRESERSSRDLLDPYLARILELNPTCQLSFQLFYMQYFHSPSDQPPIEDTLPGFLVFPYLQPDIYQSVDQAADDAENAFWSTTQILGRPNVVQKGKGFWEQRSADSGEGLE